MGRKQHQSDKLYLTTQEWKYFFGGKKPGRSTDPDEVDFKRLPFDHCSLSLQPFANPYCDEEVRFIEGKVRSTFVCLFAGSCV